MSIPRKPMAYDENECTCHKRLVCSGVQYFIRIILFPKIELFYFQGGTK